MLPLVVYADGPDGPLPDPQIVGDAVGLDHFALLLGWTVRWPDWLESAASVGLEVTVTSIGPGLRKAVDAGLARHVPTRLSAMPTLVAGRFRPDVLVIGARSDGSGGWQLAGSPTWNIEAMRHARRVVIERWPGPLRPGRPRLPDADVIAVIDRVEPPDPPQYGQPKRAHEVIGHHVAGVIPEGATVEWGTGAIGAAIVAALTRPVKVRSGLVTDELALLEARGLLEGIAAASYLWGSDDLEAMVAAGRLVPREMSYTHDLTALSSIEGFVAINTALQVGLDGSVNVEMVNGRTIASPGGHPDFAVGASRSPGGLSVIAVAATTGAASTIVPRVDVVTTPHFDVDAVVTEHGVADLRDATPAERAERLIEVAAPEHRDLLRSSSRCV